MFLSCLLRWVRTTPCERRTRLNFWQVMSVLTTCRVMNWQFSACSALSCEPPTRFHCRVSSHMTRHFVYGSAISRYTLLRHEPKNPKELANSTRHVCC